MEGSRVSTLVRSIAILTLTAACGGLYSCAVELRDVDKMAFDSVVSELVEPSRLASSELRLATNLRGEGLIIVATPRDATREPLTAWLFLSGKPYAVNSSTQALTPRLPLVSEAPTDALLASGLKTPIERSVHEVLAEATLRNVPD